jgi:hypothetical protein
LNLAFQHQHQAALAAPARDDDRAVSSTLQKGIVCFEDEPALLDGAAVTGEAFALEERFDLCGVGE